MKSFAARWLWLLLLLAAPASAQVPRPLALTLMLKVLTYDANFASHGGADFVVLVPFAPAQEDEARQVVAAGAALEQKAVAGRPLRFAAVPLAELPGKLAGAGALLAVPGTSSAAAKELAARAEKAQLYTLSLDAALVEDALALGLDVANGRPQIVINARAAKAVGAHFQPAVLKVARVLQ